MGTIIVLTLFLAGLGGLIALLIIDENYGLTRIVRLIPEIPAEIVRSSETTPGSSPEPIDRTRLYCDECGQGPMARERDVEEHKAAKHRDESISRSEPEPAKKIRHGADGSTSRGEIMNELGISYDPIDRPGETVSERSEPEIETRDRSKDIRRRKIEKFWKNLLDELNDSGKVTISKHEHYGTARGADIVRDFQQDMKRIDRADEFETSIGGSSSEIRVADDF